MFVWFLCRCALNDGCDWMFSLRACGRCDGDVLTVTLWWFVWADEFSTSVGSGQLRFLLCSRVGCWFSQLDVNLTDKKKNVNHVSLCRAVSSHQPLVSLRLRLHFTSCALSFSLREPSSAHQPYFKLLMLFLSFESNYLIIHKILQRSFCILFWNSLPVKTDYD